tara:strand:- start:48 stop:704 length:657 start_codon:yes stop_codon:yes gene_type:complete
MEEIMKTIKYDTKIYSFREVICNWLETYDLSKLHYVQQYEHFERETDQSTIWHKKFYEMIRCDESFDDVYVKFLTDVIKPRYGEEIVYQKIPTFRVHLPGNVSVGEFHKDKYYRDVKWAEKVKETNYYLPLTTAYGTNTIWAESEEDLGDYKPFNSKYGECIEWNASNLSHGNKDNITSNTRVSFDFRVIPKSRYVESNHLTINTKIPFGIGGYYEVL